MEIEDFNEQEVAIHEESMVPQHRIYLVNRQHQLPELMADQLVCHVQAAGFTQ
jgi:hypothetical protein